MPHSMPPPDEDEDLIQNLLDSTPMNGGSLDFLSRDLVPGEKADDAIDYEDIDDDDLPDEELPKDTAGQGSKGALQSGHHTIGLGDPNSLTQEGAALPAGTGDDGLELDDLFGDGPSSPAPTQHAEQAATTAGQASSFEVNNQRTQPTTVLPTTAIGQHNVAGSALTAPGHAGPQSRDEEDLIAQNFLQAPPPPENIEEFLATMYPTFKRDRIPQFMHLIPPKKSRYVGKTPLKVPKPLQLTKVALDIAPDQEKEYRTAGSSIPKKRKAAQDGIITIVEDLPTSDSSDDGIGVGVGSEGEVIGGVTWNDLEAVCQDWTVELLEDSSEADVAEPETRSLNSDDLFGDADDEWEREFGAPPRKVRHAPWQRL